MNVQGTLDLIEEVLDNGSNIPFSSKIAVDVDAIRTYIKDFVLICLLRLKRHKR